jgi:hypothetical protein
MIQWSVNPELDGFQVVQVVPSNLVNPPERDPIHLLPAASMAMEHTQLSGSPELLWL